MRKANHTIGKYVIERQLGSGAMGTVYLGYDSNLDRRAAIKVMKTGGEDETLRRRFFLEARSAAKLDHPNIVRIWNLDTDTNNRPYIAMEYIEGEDLKTFIEQKLFLPFEQKLKIVIEVCRGLDHAHDKGIIHRDIKPGNIRINRSGEAKILDFGLARLDSADSSRTRGLIGSPYYMSPEQWRGARDLDRRSDLFSVAAVLYELITYIRPFEADDIAAVMTRIISEPHVPLRDALPACASELSEILDQALAKDRDRRFSSCLEFAQALQDFQLGLPAHREEVRKKVGRIEAEFDRCKQKSRELQILEFLDSPLPEKDQPGVDVTNPSHPVSPDQTSDYGVLLRHHAHLQQQIDSLTEKLRATLPLLRLLRASHRQFEEGQLEACRQTLQELLKASPGNSSGLRLLEACRRALEERQREEEHQARLRAVLSQARQALDRGHFSRALQSISRVLEIEPSHPEALAMRDSIRQRGLT